MLNRFEDGKLTGSIFRLANLKEKLDRRRVVS